MGHVRLNDGLKSQIRQRVFAPFETRISTLVTEISNNHSIATEFYFAAISREEYDLTQKLMALGGSKRQWFRGMDELRVTIRDEVGNHQFQLKLGREYPMPMNHSTWSPFIAITHASHPSLYALVKEPLEKIRRLHADRDNLDKDLLKPVFQNCNTVKQATKLWPSIVDFLPPEALETYRSRPSQSPRQQIDLEGVAISDDAKQLLTKARMLTN